MMCEPDLQQLPSHVPPQQAHCIPSPLPVLTRLAQNPRQLQHMKCCRSHTARARLAWTAELGMGSSVLWMRVWMVLHTLLAWRYNFVASAMLAFHALL